MPLAAAHGNPGGPSPSLPTIAPSPDDVASQLEQLFDHELVEEARRSEADSRHQAEVGVTMAAGGAAEAPPPGAPHPEPGSPSHEERLVAVVEERVDELCGQLDEAFDEMAARIGRVELRVAAVRQNLDEVLSAGRAAASDMSRALAVLDDLAAADRKPAGVDAPELPAVVAQLGQVAHALHKEVADTRSSLEASVAHLAQQVADLRTRPVEIDTKDLEETASRSALRNAADIASLRHNLDGVADAVRQQERWVGEMRATLEWIKERLLLR